MSRSSHWIRAELRWALYIRDAFSCWRCGTRCRFEDLTLDHLFPEASSYHSHAPRRVSTACVKCNSSRKNRSVREVLAELPQAERRRVTARLRKSLRGPVHRDAGRALLALLREMREPLVSLEDGPGIVNGVPF